MSIVESHTQKDFYGIKSGRFTGRVGESYLRPFRDSEGKEGGEGGTGGSVVELPLDLHFPFPGFLLTRKWTHYDSKDSLPHFVSL